MSKKIILIFFCLCFDFVAIAQDNIQLAQELQKKHKDFEAYTYTANLNYTFKANASEKKVEVKEERIEEILSLRYNVFINETEVYDQNSSIIKYYGESSLKQRALNELKTCGQYTQEGYFYDDSRFCTHKLKLKEIGELWTINFIKQTKDARYFTSVYFEGSFPLREKQLRFVIPENVEVELVEFNFEGYSITKKVTKEGNNSVIEYLAKDLNGIVHERYSRGAQYYRPHILVLVKSITTNKGKENILSSVSDLYSWYHSLTLQLAPNPIILKSTVDQLVKDKSTDEEKVESIYYWVQDNIRYIAFENGIAGFKPDDAHNVFEKKYGDCKGMANLLKEMLKLAGIDARLTWVGTKQIRYDYSIPSLSVDNHMICTALIGGKKYFLDATEKYNPLDENAERIQGREVLIENGDSFIIHKIKEEDKSKDLELKKFKLKVNGEKMEGNCELILNGETRKNFLHAYHYTKADDKTKFINYQFSDGVSNISLSELKVPDLLNRKQAISIKCNAMLDNFISKFNNELYIEADPTKEYKDWELKEKRQSDIDIGKKVNTKLEVELELPSSYSLTSIPENLLIKEEEFSFNLNYKVQDNKIIYTKEITIDRGVISKKYFKVWNDSVKKLNEKYSTPIILKKIN